MLKRHIDCMQGSEPATQVHALDWDLNPQPFVLTIGAHQRGTKGNFSSHSAPMTALLPLTSAVAYDSVTGCSYICKYSWGNRFNSAHPQLPRHCQLKARSLCSIPVPSSNFTV